ncbi:transmembrane amino acid transporter protein [Skeletonema marinoi]|uniref:Transmembrane amino acid transporter protein n=1 Tax=Skeletonema marinoi TaxID=267567 RepID=A0AAD8YDU0_9STRA|nr:transmembrane amino acid transporter protein [Skeletonema marinoi]
MDSTTLRQRERADLEPLLHEEGNNAGDDDDESHHHHEHTKAKCCSNFSPGSISNLCSATLGAGALSLPYAISMTGIIFGVMFLLLSAYLTIISINIIIEACVVTQQFKFEDVSKRLVGPHMSIALEASLLVFCFGTAVAYIVAVGDILDQGLHSITFLWEPDSKFVSIYSRERVMILFWTVMLLPLSLQTKLKRLEKFSSLGVLSIIFLVIAAVIHSIIHGDVIGSGANSQEEAATSAEVNSLLWPKSFVSMLQAFPIIIFAFSCQVNVCQIYEELKPASSITDTSDDVPNVMTLLKLKQQMMTTITRNGILLCTILYLLIGVFGFLDFTKTTTDDILINYCIQVTHDALMTAATFSVFLAVVVAFPFNILPARVTLKLIFDRLKTKRRRGLCSKATNCFCLDRQPRIDEDTNSQRTSVSLEIDAGTPIQSDARGSSIEPLLDDQFSAQSSASLVEHVLITLLLSGGALIVAILVPGISIVFGLMGGTAASIISFILPGMFAQKMKERNGSTSRVGKIFVWGGLVMGILTTGTTLYGIFNTDSADGNTCTLN